VNGHRPSRIVAMVNQKGGVGKTTTAVNLGASLALLGKRVLLVDLDPQGNTTTGVGVDKRTIEGSDVYAVLLERVPLDEVVVPTAVDGLWLAPSTLALAGAEIELVGTLQRELRLKAALSGIAERYDFVLVDCPPSLGLLTVNALAAAHEIIIPVQAEYYALEGLSQLTTIVTKVRAGLNPELAILGVLITMYDGRTRLAVEVVDEVNRYFPERVFQTQIPRNIRLSEAPSFGKPAVLFDPKSRGAQAYIALARETIDGIGTASISL
jgi:chromosome partitioning protein